MNNSSSTHPAPITQNRRCTIEDMFSGKNINQCNGACLPVQAKDLKKTTNNLHTPMQVSSIKKNSIPPVPIQTKNPKTPLSASIQKPSSSKPVQNAKNIENNSTRFNNSPRSGTVSKRLATDLSSRNATQIKVLKDEVQRAIRNHKTFTIHPGPYDAMRKALRERGWIEKIHPTIYTWNHQLKRYSLYSIDELLPLLERDDVAEMCRNLIKSKLLGDHQVDFSWGPINKVFKENPNTIKYTIINRLARNTDQFMGKLSLCKTSRDLNWYQKQGISKLNMPRTYNLDIKNGDMEEFVEDFRNTAAISLLLWIVKTDFNKENKLISPNGKIPLKVFDFAMNECGKFIKKRKHEDIDTNIPKATEEEWNMFLEDFHKIIHNNNHFAAETRETESSLVKKASYVIKTLKEVWPYVDMDGMMNIWIMKPDGWDEGRGIYICRTLPYIMKALKENPNATYIIQKYIERPLLIHNTKFDIRQFFLISNCSPLTIWMYKDCCLKFSSQTYDLRNLHESIHLTNTSVQKKYNRNSADTTLPSCNMWDLNEFKNYLAKIGNPDVFKNVIYPEMKQGVITACLMHQDLIIIRKNSFELFGADFMLTEDFQPWLLEVNYVPGMSPTTPVWAQLCPRVLEDVVRVIIDYPSNKKANTGDFELIYKEPIIELPAPVPLQINGVALKSNYFHTPTNKRQTSTVEVKKFAKLPMREDNNEKPKSFTENTTKKLNNEKQIIRGGKGKSKLKSKHDKKDLPLSTKAGNKHSKT